MTSNHGANKFEADSRKFLPSQQGSTNFPNMLSATLKF